MREKLLIYRSLTGEQKYLLEDAIEQLSRSSTNTPEIDTISMEIDSFEEEELYKKLFEIYVGNERVAYLRKLLDYNTYIITLNSSIDAVYGVLVRINPTFDKNRIYSVRNIYNNMISSFIKGLESEEEKREKTLKIALGVKLKKIISLLDDGNQKALFVDDMFTEEFFASHKEKTKSIHKNVENIDYFHIDDSMDGIEEEHIREIIETKKYDKLFLDFDDTITRDISYLPDINGVKYTYSFFLNRGMQ